MRLYNIAVDKRSSGTDCMGLSSSSAMHFLGSHFISCVLVFSPVESGK